MPNYYAVGRQGQEPGFHTEGQESYQNYRQEGHQAPGTWSPTETPFSYGDINYGPPGRNLNGLPLNGYTHNPLGFSKGSNQTSMQSFGQRLNSVGRGRSLAINTPNLQHHNALKDTYQTSTFNSFSPTRITSPDGTKLGHENEGNIWSDPVTRRNSDEYLNSFQFSNKGLSVEFYKTGPFTAQPSPLPFYGSSDLHSPKSERFDSFPRKASAPAPANSFRSIGASQPFNPTSHKGDFNFGTTFLEEQLASRQNASRLPVHSNEYPNSYADQDRVPNLSTRDNRNQYSVASTMDLAQLSISSPETNCYSFNHSNKLYGTSKIQSPSQNFDYQHNDATRNEIHRQQNLPSSHGKNNHSIQVPPAAGLCRFFLQGFCTKANRCKFRHVSKDEYQRVMSQFKEPVSNINRPRYFQTQRQNPPDQGRPKPVPFSINTQVQRYSQPLSPTSNSPVHMQIGLQPYKETLTPKIEKAPKLSDLPPFGTQLDLRFLSQDLGFCLNDLTSLCSDQNGCRFLQKKLEEKIPYQTQIIFQEVSKIFVTLMTDPFGNYLCQKLMEHCSASQLIYLARLSSPFLLQVALNSHGTRTLQKMLDFCCSSLSESSSAVVILTQSLQSHVIELIKDLSGNHVIQKCLAVLPPELNQFIFDLISSNIMDVATHRHGCCVIQRCMENASEHQQRQLALAIIEASSTLVQDPFGNYVIQAVLDLGIPEFVSLLFKNFQNRICTLSVQKYSSNVIEKCIRLAPSTTRCHIIQELLNLDRFDLLIRDSYANYVVQTCLEVAEPDQRVQLVRCIEPYLNCVKETAYGKRILDCISRFDSKPFGNNQLQPSGFNSSSFTNNFPGGASPSRQEDQPSPILA